MRRIERILGGFFFRLNEMIYYVKCALYYKYNRVTATHIPPTYIDKDHLLFHTCFQILVDFVEKEEPWQCDCEMREIWYSYYKYASKETRHSHALKKTTEWMTIRNLYKWYKEKKYKSATYDEITDKLRDLVSLRGNYWTI